MNLRKATLLSLWITIGHTLWAQNQGGLITGKLADEKGKPVAFADVIITDSPGKVFAGTASDISGAFHLRFNRAGHFLLKMRHIGYQTQQRRLDLQAGDSLKLGTLVLKPSERRLAAVKVSKHKLLIEQQIDRLVFHVDNSLVAKSGGDALDALRISPKVWVKAEMGQIEMIGKKGVSVLIDGRFSRLSGGDLIAFLQGIPASDIERIEVISNPPAQYEAANNSGLINIVMKHRSNYWNAHIIPSYSQSTYPTGGIKGMANYQKNRLSATAFSNLTQGARAPEEESVYFYPAQRWEENHKSKNFTDSKSGRLTVEYRPSDKWTLGSQLVATSSHPENKSHIRTAIFGRGHAQSDSIIQTNRRALSDSKHIAVNLFSDFKLGAKGAKKLHLNFDFFDHDADSDSRFCSTLLKPMRQPRHDQSQSAGLNITNYAAKADLVLPYKRLEWSFGGKISATKAKRSSQFHSIAVDPALLGRVEPNQTDAFEYRESIAAGYVSSRIHWDDKWGTQLGLRYEHTHTRGISKTMGRDTKNGYSDLFPTAYISYAPNDHNAFSLSYGRRIGRPNFHHLNPFEHFSDPFSYRVGNPELKPEFIHNIEFNHIYKNDLTTTLYYSLTDDAFSYITGLKSQGVREVKVLNNFQLQELGLLEGYAYRGLDFLEAYINAYITWCRSQSKRPALVPSTESWDVGIDLYAIVQIRKGLSALLDLSYSPPDTYMNQKMKSEYADNIGLRYNLMQGRMQIQAWVMDVLRINKQRFTDLNQEFTLRDINYEDVQRFTLTLKYRIGNAKIKESKIKSSNEAEAHRTKKPN